MTEAPTPTKSSTRGREPEPEWLFLHDARKAKDMSQKELAATSGLWQNQITEFERGVRPPNLYQLVALANALDLSPVKLAEEAIKFFIK